MDEDVAKANDSLDVIDLSGEARRVPLEEDKCFADDLELPLHRRAQQRVCLILTPAAGLNTADCVW